MAPTKDEVIQEFHDSLRRQIKFLKWQLRLLYSAVAAIFGLYVTLTVF